ncbi:hypothetical protein [Agrobacterium salinitolerans]|uniref:hypothetical protein n=1 Tax=Agrobacterium salinitolerans TaxID=1183413 RepID=UPI001573B6DA|nr:hypothetical protein [Agrobacterium salinitolerans]NTA40195.1 hypothetical protein [Agrobacterium salinitolerans]
MQFPRELGRITVLLYPRNPDIAARLNALLTSRGMAVTTALTASELHGAAGIGDFHVSATYTAGIAIIREITGLPIVNIDAFIFQRPMQPDETKAARQFDTAAFIKRLTDVASLRTTRRS